MSYSVGFIRNLAIGLSWMLIVNSASATCIVTEICVDEEVLALLESAEREDLQDLAIAFERESKIYSGQCPEVNDEQSYLCKELVSYQREAFYFD